MSEEPESPKRRSVHSSEARLNAFFTLGHRLSSARSQRAAIKIILDIADSFFGWDACTFDSYSAETDIVRPVIVVDRFVGERRDVEPVVRNQAPTRRMRQIIEQGPTLILRKPPIQMPTDAIPMGDQSRPSASLMYVPVRSSDQVIGLLSIQSYTPDAYTVEDLNLLQALADHGAGALDRIQAEEQIKELNSELERHISERTAALQATVGELETFSYSLSHDMRAPLRAMHGFAQLLLEQYPGKILDETGVDFLHRIERAAARLDLLIRDVLSYTRTLRGELKTQTLQIPALIRDVLDANPQWCESGARIQVVEPMPKVAGSEALMVQCISNLLSNAIKFVKPGTPPEIKIRAEEQAARVRLWIEDNGIGIAPEHHGRIFGMFQRLHPSTEIEGTGIGLTIVRKGVERMSGSVGFESTPGQGSQFWIELPKGEQ